MIFYAIRHIPTGGYLPQRNRKRRGGFTHDEPSTTQPPRLFKSAHDANVALTWWLRGATWVTAKSNADPFFGADIEEDWKTKLDPTRSKIDMEVVCVALLEERLTERTARLAHEREHPSRVTETCSAMDVV